MGYDKESYRKNEEGTENKLNEEQEKLKWIKKVSPVLYDIALAALCLYIGLRGRRWLNALLPFESGPVVFGLLLLFYIFNLMMVHNAPCTRHRRLVFTVSTCTFCAMYLGMSLVAVDLVQLILKIFLHDGETLQRIFIVCGFLCVAAVIIATIAGLRHASQITTVRYESRSGKLSENRRIVLLTDLHIGYFVGRRHIHNMVERVNALHADAVLISGDIFNGGGTGECQELDAVAEELAQMTSAAGTFAVTGNHDPDPKV